MAKIKLPYTMYCSACKVGIKIKNEKSIGTFIHCPKCKRRIEVVTPEMDGNIPYGIGDEVEAAPELGLTDAEKIELEAAELRHQKWVRSQRIKFAFDLILTLAGLGVCGYIFYQKIYVEGYGSKPAEKSKLSKRKGG